MVILHSLVISFAFTVNGIIIRMSVSNVSEMGRVTKGVKLINIKNNNKVASISIVDKEETDD